MEVSFKIEGLDGLEAALGDLKRATARNVSTRTLKRAGEEMARSARTLVHSDKGYLRESIDVLTRAVEPERESDVEVYIGPGRDPAGIQEEFGNRYRDAHPFVTPAWDETKMLMLDIIITLLGIEIEKAAARAAKRTAKLR